MDMIYIYIEGEVRIVCVLIVDSQPLMRRGIREALISYYKQLDIYEASNYCTSLTQLKQNKFQMAIVDLHLEEESGFPLIEKIKSDYPETRILILTAAYNLLEFQRAIECNVDGYLLKSAFEEDFLYAFQVVSRGEIYYSMKVLDQYKNSDSTKLKMLTKREKEVFEQLSKGLTNTQISKKLYISEATTKKYISNILYKLNLTNRIEVVFFAKHLCEC
jgi:DNA-binding NarL/FixJ family response regulator